MKVKAFAFSLLALPLFARAAPAPDLRDIIRKLDDLYRSQASMSRVELISKTETQTRHLQMRMWSKGKRDKTLIIIDSPARESGTATLKVGKNLWNYLPKISKTIRIPPSMMLSSWMGTDFTNDDLVKDSSYEDDFESDSPFPAKNSSGWTVVMHVKPGIVGRWQKIEWTVSNVRFLPVEAKYYDRKGRLARTIRFEDVKKMGGREIPTRMILASVDQPNHETQIHYLDIQFDAPITDSLFSLSELEKR